MSLTGGEALPEEPLAESAPFARQLALAACAQDEHGDGCAPYHGFWQYLRLMGLGKTMSGMSAAFVHGIREVAQARAGDGHAARVLISGCADYSAFAHVAYACRDLQPRPSVTALDLCQTPLLLTRWYARRAGWAVDTVCSDVLHYRTERHYDLILTSSFLGYFSPAERPKLFADYANLLAPGGVLLFTNRLRAEPEDRPVGFSAEQADAFAERVAALSGRLPPEEQLPADLARRMARAYAARFVTYPVNGEATIRSLARGAGLEWWRGDSGRTEAAQRGVTGPTLADGAAYLFVMLRKPAPA
jgi:SAM-dependent methyltransferase